MSRTAPAHEALDELVNQFADPLSCFRELIQNAVDAGSPAVDVSFEFRAEADTPERGAMVIHVDDYGEGMNREIIDKRLTRLFSSGKDGDLTKIGRFGIGFVSVFALSPDAVVVDTARGGESWRVLFGADRTFQRIARDEPVDGTKGLAQNKVCDLPMEASPPARSRACRQTRRLSKARGRAGGGGSAGKVCNLFWANP